MRWVTRKIVIDLETGEIIPEKEWYKYQKIKQIKQINANQQTQRGVISYTIEARRAERYQGKLWE